MFVGNFNKKVQFGFRGVVAQSAQSDPWTFKYGYLREMTLENPLYFEYTCTIGYKI